jgi:hypothetical protein
MPSKVALIAEAIKDELNGAPGGTFAFGFVAVRRYVPNLDLDSIGEALSVQVVARADNRELLNRGGDCLREIPIDIGVQRRLATGTNPQSEGANAELDAMLALVEQIADFLEPGMVVGVEAKQAVVTRTLVDPLYAPEHLMSNSVFTSIVHLTLKLF